MKKVYLESKIDIGVNKNYGVIKGELLTFAEYARLGLNSNDIKWFDMVEIDTKDTYISFKVRKPLRFANKRYLSEDEKEKYL